jgi:hypothetical protein
MPITAHTKKTRFGLHYMKRLNIFFQDWVFGHRVAFKRLLAATIDQRWSAQEGCSVTG